MSSPKEPDAGSKLRTAGPEWQLSTLAAGEKYPENLKTEVPSQTS
jgi:hypothetical protein